MPPNEDFEHQTMPAPVGVPDFPFPADEYRRRVERTKKAMVARGLDVLVAPDPANMNWLTGYDAWSFYTPQCAVVALDVEEPIIIVRLMDRGGAKVTTWLSDENLYGYPDNYVQSEERHPMHYVAGVLEERGIAKGRIGVEMDAYYYTARSHAELARSLPNATVVDGTNVANWERAIKSEAEVAYIREAARLVERSMEVGIATISRNTRQCDAVASICDAHYRGFYDYGGEYSAIVPMLPTGIGTSTPHLTWSPHLFREGEATILELAGCRRRYHCPMARTVFLGKPPQLLLDTAETLKEALIDALDAVKPGVTAEEVHAAWYRTATRGGLEKESRIGYSTGLNYPPDWGEHTLSLRPGDRTELQPGMVIHMIPGYWQDTWGIEISECFLVTENGAECFCDFPRDIQVKE